MFSSSINSMCYSDGCSSRECYEFEVPIIMNISFIRKVIVV